MTSLFVIGGARSGKSRYAQGRTEAMPGKLVYVATAQALDDEMAERIAHHKSDRGERWHSIEAPTDLPHAIACAQSEGDAILVDCLTLWLSNLMLADADLPGATTALLNAISTCRVPVTLVANEVGLGIVPDNALARRFRDDAGRLNQQVAHAVDEVVFVAAGLPMRLK